MTSSMLVGSTSREDPPPVGMGTTHDSSIKVEAMGAPCTDGGSGAGVKVESAPLRSTLCSPVVKSALWPRSYYSS